MYGDKVVRWERWTKWPLVVAGALFLLTFALEVIDPDSWWALTVARPLLIVLWALFATDYAVRLVLAERRWHWFRRHLLDLAIVLLPMFRPLQLVEFVALLILAEREAGAATRGRVATYAVFGTVLAVFVASLAVLEVERGGSGPIRSFPDALWWSVGTVTTVGAEGVHPVTDAGRAVSFLLTLVGLALLGVVTALLTSWVLERVTVSAGVPAPAGEDQVEELRAEMAELRTLLAAAVEERERPAGDGLAGSPSAASAG